MSGGGAGETEGDLAIVLHSHMPYVEGFGTYPFGEEWLFDAVVRSYLPVLEVARDLTLTVTPVLADQLEDAGAAERLRRFLVDFRIGSAEADLARRRAGAAPRLRGGARPLPPCAGAARRGGRRPAGAIPAGGGGGTGGARRVLGHPRAAAADRDPRRAGAAARRRDRLAPSPLRLGRRLLAAGVRLRPGAGVGPGAGRGRVVLRRPERATRRRSRRSARSRRRRGRSRCRSTGRRSPGSGRSTAIPRTPPTPCSTANRCAGCGSGGSAAGPTTRRPRRRRRGARRRSSSAAIAGRLRGYAAERGRRGLIVFAIDTELLGHWWSEGPLWLAAVLEGAAAAGVRLVTVPEALEDHEPERRPLRRSSWGEDKDFSTWDSPPVADLAWAARRLELRLLRAVARRARGRPRRARGAGAARPPVQRLGLPRPPRPGRGLRLAAGDRPLAGLLRSHRMRPCHRSAYAFACPGHDADAAPGALKSAPCPAS